MGMLDAKPGILDSDRLVLLKSNFFEIQAFALGILFYFISAFSAFSAVNISGD